MIFTLLTVLSNTVKAEDYALSVWPVSEMCQQEPQQIYVFPVNDPSSSFQGADENWPSFYQLLSPPFPYQSCGNCQARYMNGDCCFSAIQNYQGMQSGIAVPLDFSNSGYSRLPQGVSGKTYCQVFPNTSPSLFPYTDLFILNNGVCIDYFSCLDGVLSIYELSGCSGSMSTVDTREPFSTTSRYGNITASVKTFDEGSSKVAWVRYYPGKDLVPSYNHGIEVMETIFFVLCILGQLSVCIYMVRRYILWKTQQNLLLTTAQTVLFVFVVLRTAYIYAIFESVHSMWALRLVQEFLYGLATITISFYNCKLSVTLLNSNENEKKVIYTCLFLVHFWVAGSAYFQVLLFAENTILPLVVLYWGALWNFWIILYFAGLGLF